MNFFEHQDVARKNTGWLVIFFALAVVGIIVATYLVVAVFIILISGGSVPGLGAGGGNLHAQTYRQSAPAMSLWEPTLLLGIGAGVLLVVGSGTLYKLMELRAGGKRVAETLGGELIDPDRADPQERKLLNVVEEMSIASGTPVPPVYVLRQEEGINAFAAGYTPADAVIGVTQGTVKRLSRDELQGVIAHEFSHILNGDMRLNIRLIGILNGILIIGMVGLIVLRSAFYSSVGRRYRSRRSRGNPLPLIALGAALMAVGYLGMLFGRLIKAAVSRQREFLADASAVQFTRNPSGLAGALKRIGGLTRGSRVVNPSAEEASHMFFGQAKTSWLDALFATHPKLPERIQRIDPSWDGQYISGIIDQPESAPRGRHAAVAGFAGTEPPATRPKESAARVGTLDEAHLTYAAGLIEGLAAPIRAAAHDPFAARAMVYALLINTDQEARDRQLAYLQANDWGAAQTVKELLPHVERMQPRERLPALELTMSALRRLSRTQYADFHATIDALVRADGKTNLFEWMVQQVVLRGLEAEFGKAAPRRIRYYGLGKLTEECSVLLSTLAYAGHRGQQARQSAFAAGAASLEGVGSSLRMMPVSECGLSRLEKVLKRLDETAPRVKRQIIDACAATVMADRDVTATEAEILRAVSAVLGCPMPPLLAEEADAEGQSKSAVRMTASR